MPGSLKVVMGFNDFRSASVSLIFPNSCNIAPVNALAAGGYFNANRASEDISLSFNSEIMAKSLVTAALLVVSGIFLMYRTASSICSKVMFSLVIVFFCLMNEIEYRSRLNEGRISFLPIWMMLLTCVVNPNWLYMLYPVR